jgi:hypothetical protein
MHESIAHQNTAGVQRLSDDDSVNALGKKLSELIDVHVRGGEKSLIQILTRARNVIMLRQNIVLGRSQGESAAGDEKNDGRRQNLRSMASLGCNMMANGIKTVLRAESEGSSGAHNRLTV